MLAAMKSAVSFSQSAWGIVSSRNCAQATTSASGSVRSAFHPGTLAAASIRAAPSMGGSRLAKGLPTSGRWTGTGQASGGRAGLS